MVRASINPETITGKRPTKETALKMVSSGALLNAPAFTGSAANKIVDFDRTKVQPKPNNLQALIQNLSSNIYNNLTNIQNVFGEKKETKERKGVFGFFGNLKETISLIQFLGSKKNLDKLKENLQNLKDSFFEAFESAKALRKVIKKIYDQLSGMEIPSGEGGGGNGLLNILSGLLGLRTGSKLLGKGAPGIGRAAATIGEKEAGMLPKALRFLGSPGKMLLGAGALAAGGALASGATSGLAEPGGEELQTPDQSQTEISGSVLDKFNSVLDRFDKAIESLLKGKTPGKTSGKPSSKQKPSDSSAGTSGGRNGGAPLTPIDTSGSFAGSKKSEQAYNYFVSKGLSPQQSAAMVGNLLQENVAMDPTKVNSIGMRGIAQWDATRWNNLQSFAKQKGLDPNDFQTQLQFVYQELATGQGGLSLENLKAQKTLEGATLLIRKQYERPGEAEANDTARLNYARKVLAKGGNIEVSAAVQPVQQPVRSALAAPGKPGQPQVSFVNLDGGAQTQVAPSGSGIVAPPAPPQNGPTAPSGSSFNSDNFLVLYSRMVYNIVDG